ncbi:MAG: hypothetical protein UY57_C0017G0009, partial [Candidatus Kaiserbacteria bacterium GW2011_GWB1_50_17]
AGVFYMFGDGIDDEFALLRHAVYLYFSRVLDEFGDDDRMIGRNIRRALQEFEERFFVRRHFHRGAGENVRWADECGITDFLGGAGGGFRRADLGPRGLVNLQFSCEEATRGCSVFVRLSRR